ncbi:hypothetical protein Barb7_03013 [Bacteroidales bacterium Barb7]|nr:hypothetical protein Barb6XT_02338 [Bacteroidales bacterium Barb6XT]OAV73032.1 hypothetical protein Barb7_03013 [Bacteroidales bacterium Barb7]
MERCCECGASLSDAVADYSINYFGLPLCRTHQDWIRQLPDSTTNEAITLYFTLKQKGIPAELEKYDGHKHIDIAIVNARLNIEVDGGHHNYSSKQALADLQRTYFSLQKGYYTIRIPNSLIKDENSFNEAVVYIENLYKERLKQKHQWTAVRKQRRKKPETNSIGYLFGRLFAWVFRLR